MRVGVKTASPPFGFIGTHGEHEGFDVDVTKWLSSELFGSPDAVRFVPVTSQNEIGLLNAGTIDILADAAITPERGKEVALSIPYFVTGHLILQRDDERPLSFDDLSGKRVAAVAGSSSDAVVGGKGANDVRFSSIAEALQALREGRVDAVVAKDEIVFAIEKEHPELNVTSWHPFAVVRCGLAVRKGDDAWLAFVNERLTAMKKTSQYRELLEKWFGLVRALLYERMLTS